MQEILEHYLKGKPLADDVDGQTFAAKTPGFSGAQLANMINEAALFAAKSGAEAITADMLEEARDKVMMGRERSLTRTEVCGRFILFTLVIFFRLWLCELQDLEGLWCHVV